MSTHDRRRVALVTGANKGIGKAVAEALAHEGLFVLLGSRDIARGRAAAADLERAGDVRFVQLDVTDDASVDAAARGVAEGFGRLDVLVNNAGCAAGSPQPSATRIEDLRRVYETNVFGVVRVTNALLPLLRAAPAARVVNVSSRRGSLGDPEAWVGQPVMAYSSSKTALNAVTVHYARELANTAIKVNGASPGHVATDFNQHRGTRTPAEGAAIIVKLALLGPDGPTGGVFDDDGPQVW